MSWHRGANVSGRNTWGNGVNFYLSLGISGTITVVCYFLMVSMLNHYGVKL